MKTDIWLTQSTSPDLCPLCSKQLKEGSKTCFSCGFSLEPPPGSSVWIDPAVYRFQSSHATESRRSSSNVSAAHKPSSHTKKHSNPTTPIPPRASAQRSGGIKAVADGTGRASHQQHAPQNRQSRSTAPLGRREVPTPKPSQPIIWQYDSQKFEAGSSLPSLSLLVPELPTEPGVLSNKIEERSPATPTTPRLSNLDEIDTIPDHLVSPVSKTVRQNTPAPRTIDEIDTQPGRGERFPSQLPVPANKAVIPLAQQRQPAVVEIGSMPSQSWTAGGSAESYYAQYIASGSKQKRRQGIALNPIDRVRWELLHPGRMEFILWLGGTILLIIVTCALLLVSALSFNWIVPQENTVLTTSSTTNTTRNHMLPTVVTAPGLIFKLLDKGPLLPGQSFSVHGEGFSPDGHISFTLDGMQPLRDANGQPSATIADAHGTFTFTFRIGDSLQWTSGDHLLVARDITTNRVAALYLTIAPAPIGKAITPISSIPPAPGGNTPVVGVTATPTQTQGNPGSTPTPMPTAVLRTPVSTPTQGITPTPTSPPPTPTPTKTATSTPTPGITPTKTATPKPTATAAIVTPTAEPTSSSSNSNLSTPLTDDAMLAMPLANLSPLVWLMIGCYSGAMLLLGVAGVLHKRHK